MTDLRLPIFNHFSSVTDLGLPIFNHFLKQTLALYLKVWIIVKSSVIALQINCLKQNRCPDSTRAPNFSVFWYHNCCTSGRSLRRWLQPQAHPGVGPGQGEALEPVLLGLQLWISGQRSAWVKTTCHLSFNPIGQGPDVVPHLYPQVSFGSNCPRKSIESRCSYAKSMSRFH